jgi:hypothetical protein
LDLEEVLISNLNILEIPRLFTASDIKPHLSELCGRVSRNELDFVDNIVDERLQVCLRDNRPGVEFRVVGGGNTSPDTKDGFLK